MAPSKNQRRRSALSEADLDNVSLRMENAVLKAFNTHREMDHKPISEKLEKLNMKMVGIGAATGAALLGAKSAIAKIFGMN